MRKLLFVALLSLPQWALATGDSLSYLTVKDTVLLSVGQFEELYLTHYLAPKQTLFSLAQFYGLSLSELYFYNRGLENGRTYIGMPIYVPLPKRSIRRYWQQNMAPGQFAPVYYLVRRGDTLYRICKNYFHMPMEEVMARNALADHTLKPDQLLHIGWLSVEGVPDSLRKLAGNELGRRNAAYKKLYQFDMVGKREIEHQGAAYWPQDLGNDADLYALHRSAAINSIISIYSPMSNRTVYAKVIGRIPDTAYRDNVVVVVSPLVAKLLNAIDPRFFVKVKYRK